MKVFVVVVLDWMGSVRMRVMVKVRRGCSFYQTQQREKQEMNEGYKPYPKPVG